MLAWCSAYGVTSRPFGPSRCVYLELSALAATPEDGVAALSTTGDVADISLSPAPASPALPPTMPADCDWPGWCCCDCCCLAANSEITSRNRDHDRSGMVIAVRKLART